MGLFDKIKEALNAPDDDYDLPDDNFYNNPPREEEPDPQPVMEQPAKRGSQTGNKVVNIHATTQLQVVLVKPEIFEEVTTIANHLNDKRTVVLNLESAPKDIARRLVDFLSGVAYANGGQIKKVANSTFIITPFNVDIMGDLLLDELESNGYSYQ